MSETATYRQWKSKKKTNTSASSNNFKNNKKTKKILKRTAEQNEISLLKKRLKVVEQPSANGEETNQDQDPALSAESKYFKKYQNVDKFEKFPISKSMANALKSCHFNTPTIIQKRTLPITLKRDNLIAAAKTGSGKTLAFVIPILEDLYREEYSELEGVAALVLAPTRELACQIQLVFKRLIQASSSHTLSASAITGGSDMYFEASLISRNQIIVATPGRLLQHLEQTVNFSMDNLRTLVLDEADRMLDPAFKEQLKRIVEFLPEEYQTLLFSATGKAYSRSQFEIVSKKSKSKLHVISDELEEDAIKSQMAKDPKDSTSTQPEKLQQIYCQVKAQNKLSFLYNFLKSKQKNKILIFASTCKQVGYLHEIFQIIQPGTLKVLQLRGSNTHKKRQQQFDEFIRKQSGVLIATDLAARGLDVSKSRINDRRYEGSFTGKGIDWVVHFDAPDTIETYIHRSGRTARAGNKGKSMLMVLPEELDNCLQKFQKNKIFISEKRINSKKVATSITKNLQSICVRDKVLHDVAKRAFGSYFEFLVFSKKNNNSRMCLLPESVGKLDLDEFAGSYGLLECPELKHFKINKKQSTPKSVKLLASDDESDDDLMTVKTESNILSKIPEAKTEISDKKKKPKVKEITQEKALKKSLLGKKNNKTTFDSGSEEEETKEEISAVEVKTLNIQEQAEQLKKSDKKDKLSYKERKLERKRLLKQKKKQAKSVQIDGYRNAAELEGDDNDDNQQNEDQRYDFLDAFNYDEKEGAEEQGQVKSAETSTNNIENLEKLAMSMT